MNKNLRPAAAYEPVQKHKVTPSILGWLNQFQWLEAWASLVNLPTGDCHWTSLIISQHWFRWWLGAVRQQAITWANVDPDSCHNMASLGHNELNRACNFGQSVQVRYKTNAGYEINSLAGWCHMSVPAFKFHGMCKIATSHALGTHRYLGHNNCSSYQIRPGCQQQSHMYHWHEWAGLISVTK